MASPAGRIRTRRAAEDSPRGGGIYVSDLQRARLLDATFAVVAEEGYRRMTVRKVSGRAGVSNKTFYDLFADREECFLAAFDLALERLATAVIPAWESEKEWTARIRAGLATLLGVLDDEPALRALVFVEALGAGPRVLARRAEVLERVAGAIDEGRVGVKVGRELPPLTAEGIVGAVFGVIYARLSSSPAGWGEASRSRTQGAWLASHASDRGRRDAPPIAALLNSLMATIVLPYRGHKDAARELARQAPLHTGVQGKAGKVIAPVGSLATPVDFRLTVRTHMVLAAVAEHPGGSNREVSDAAGVADQGQISKLLMRLEGLGLLRNVGGDTQGIPNAWYLTPRGEEIARLSRGQEHRSRQGAQR
jgi:AcrR family transcriptional regulator/DNA-binding MarR family transcriptional regulator